MTTGRLDTAIVAEIVRLREEANRLLEEKASLERQLEQAQKENHEFAAMYVEMQEQNAAVTSLYVASQRLHATLEPDEVIQIIMEILVEMIGAEEFGILLYDEEKKCLELVAGEGAAERLPSKSLPVGAGIVGDVAASGEPFYFESKSAVAREAGLPLAAIPLNMKHHCVGVVIVYKLLSHKADFSPVDHQVMELLAAHAATALASARLHKVMDRKLKTMRGFMELIKS